MNSALIVEDLAEPRQWLAELLRSIMPDLKQIDLAETRAQAQALVTQRRLGGYDLALVDWGLPDGNAEPLIRLLTGIRPDSEVIVATIHDDDAHVFAALRAGATGYILKSQPSAVVRAQLQGILRGEPALSPSVALRVLRHFREPASAASAGTVSSAGSTRPAPAGSAPSGCEATLHLSAREVEVLRLIGKGYSAPEVARLLGISSHTASSYVRDIYRKLGISSRAEAAMEAARRGLVA